MKRPRVIGLTGSMQSGKQELEPVFERAGFRFLDLNQFADAARAEGSPHRARYIEMGLAGGLGADGRESMAYFDALTRNPALHRATMAIEVEEAVAGAKVAIAALQPTQSIVINWGYTYQLLQRLPFEFVFLFRTREQVWLDRIRRAACKRGRSNPPMSDGDIIQLATAIEMMPGLIEEAVRAHMGDRWVKVDTSAHDWGAAELVKTFQQLDW